jgi:predicted HAD superfamily Cof-like phosphohydrolase
MLSLTPQQMLEEFHATFGGEEDDELRWRLLDEELAELREAYERDDLTEIADAIADIVYILVGTAHLKGIPFDRVLAEVHRSNMTKLGPDGKARRRADGKILKPPTFEPPRIREILEEVQSPASRK